MVPGLLIMYSGFFLGLLAIVAIIPLHETADILKGVVCNSDTDCKPTLLTKTCCKALQAGKADSGICVTEGTCCGILTNTGNAVKECPEANPCCPALGLCLGAAECSALCDYDASPAANTCLDATKKCCKIETSGVNTGACLTDATCPKSL